MKLARFKQDAQDRRRYTVDYLNWLEEDEVLTGVTITGNNVPDNFVLDDEGVDTTGKVIVFYASGGIAARNYYATLLVTTSLSQIREDYVVISIT